MKKRKIIVYIQSLNISRRTKRILIRAGVTTLNELEEESDRDFSSLKGMGSATAQEITAVLKEADSIFEKFENRKKMIDSLPEELCNTDISQLSFTMRENNALRGIGINKIGDLLRMSSMDMYKLRNISTKSLNRISETIETIISSTKEENEKRTELVKDDKKENPANGFQPDEICMVKVSTADDETVKQLPKDEQIGKGFDFEVIDRLISSFFMKPSCMAKWFDLSHQGIYDALNRRSPKRIQKWTEKEMTESESQTLTYLIKNKQFEYDNDDDMRCYCFNNRKDDFVSIFVYKNEIKCFFLNDMSSDLQSQIIRENMQRFTKKELDGEADGVIVYIIKKPYFLPKQPNMFRINAQMRGLTVDEYAKFISGYPIADQRSITDDRIIKFMEENCIDGKVYISSDPKNQWIRSIASRNGYHMKEFIELYGFVPKMEGDELTTEGARERHVQELRKCVIKDNIVYFPTDSRIYRILSGYAHSKNIQLNDYIKSLGFVRTIERPEMTKNVQEADMQVYKSDGKFEEKVFAQYPLLGSKLISPESLDMLNQNARRYIDKVLKDPSSKIPLRAEMQITLSMINYVKNWNREENSGFWDYIVLQFGYRDTKGTVVHILQTVLEDALKKNKKLFIEDANGRAFKSTLVIHAMSPKKSWLALFDFLFDFYKNNLDWKLFQDDPLLDIMIRELRHKLSGDSTEDVELTIGYQVYSFQEGIRKLILFRPKYTRVLFEKLLHRIDDLINSVNKPVNTYEELLCEEWFKEKLLSIANTKKKDSKSLTVQREVAIDYTRIRAKFMLKNENCVQVVLPDIRLKTENFSSIFFNISYDGKTVYHQPMSWYGNELGKTLNSVAVELPKYENGNGILNVQLTITCDDEEVYNSNDELYRRAIVFSNKHEVNADKMECGNYTLIIPSDTVIECENVVLTEIDSFRQQGIKGYFVELDEGYAIVLDGTLVTFDNDNSMGIRVVSPMEMEDFPEFTKNDTSYHFVYKNSACNIIIPNTYRIDRYKLLRNKERIDFDELKKTIAKQERIYVFPIENEDFCHIQIVDMETERLIYDRGFIAVSHLACGFNREFYFLPDDFIDSRYDIQGDNIHEIVHFSFEDDEIIIPFRDGFVHKAIPKVQIIETTGLWLSDKGTPAWYIGDIPQNSLFKVFVPPETKARFIVGGSDIEYDGHGIVSIGNILQSLFSKSNLTEIKVEVELTRGLTVQRYELARVFCKERFIKNPEFWYQDNKLYWDRGIRFIGKTNRKFTLTLFDEMDCTLVFELDEETEYVMLPDQINVGNYKFEISVLSGGLFKKTKEIVARGNCVIGDENVLRFKNRRIVINTITDEFNEKAGHIEIRKCYIDQLEFKGVQETSEGLCPVYVGIMYTDGYRGERYEFSFDFHTTRQGIKKIMVNPVRIVYIGNKTLCITDSEGDGLYYYNYYDEYLNKKVFALTDREYTVKNKSRYSTADLYSYCTERI